MGDRGYGHGGPLHCADHWLEYPESAAGVNKNLCTARAFFYKVGNCRKQRTTAMASHCIAHFQNDIGAHVIEIGVREFMCCGASAPFDHPHVYLDMGEENEIVCPYCSTLYGT